MGNVMRLYWEVKYEVNEEEATVELKQTAIDNYVNLLRIKASENAVNEELDRQLRIARLKLSSLDVDASELDEIF